MSSRVKDFHVHSNCSDGLFAPSEMVRYAGESGVEELSLTDHDTLAGLGAAERTAVRLGIQFIPGIELTCRSRGRMIHLLGYGFRPSVAFGDAEFMAHLEGVKQRDREWARQMCLKSQHDPLVVKGSDGHMHAVSVASEELDWALGTMPSPFHLAKVVSDKLARILPRPSIPARHCMYLFTGRPEPERQHESYWPQIRERYADHLAQFGLVPKTYWWVPRPMEELYEVGAMMKILSRIGGIPVLAHPGEQNIGEEEITEMAGLGLRGVETYTFKHGLDLVRQLEALTERLGLVATAGTDFHDPNHRAHIEPGRDQSGEHLRKGAAIDDLRKLGA